MTTLKLAENGKLGLAGRFPSLPLVQALSIFDLQRLLAKETTTSRATG